MTDSVRLRIDGEEIEVRPGTLVAAAVARHRRGGAARRDLGGELRGPLCGMGICFECRAHVDGHSHVRTCMLVCREGMEVRTDA